MRVLLRHRLGLGAGLVLLCMFTSSAHACPAGHACQVVELPARAETDDEPTPINHFPRSATATMPFNPRWLAHPTCGQRILITTRNRYLDNHPFIKHAAFSACAVTASPISIVDTGYMICCVKCHCPCIEEKVVAIMPWESCCFGLCENRADCCDDCGGLCGGVRVCKCLVQRTVDGDTGLYST